MIGRGGAAAVLAVLVLGGCGSGGGGSRGPASAVSPRAERFERSVTLLMDRAPRSLDPAGTATPQGEEVLWPVYTGLVSVRHASGRAGRVLVPGLAAALPAPGDGGRTYRVVLRRGLRFSNGRPVRASDFTEAVERAIGNPDNGVRRLLISLIRGAPAFASGRVSSVTGVVADDVTGVITIHLRRSYGAFDDVLATPALGLVSGDAPLRADPDDPPVGAGPYRLVRVRAGRSFTLQRNPYWHPLPGIPAGRLDVDVRISRDVSANVSAVLNNVADVLDPQTPVPAHLRAEIRRRAPHRFSQLGAGPVDYVFLDPQRWPFSRRLARKALLAGLSETRLVRDAAGAVSPRCAFAPPVLGGRAESCGDRPGAGGDLTRARELARRSGTLGAEVAMLAPESQPERRWLTTTARVLRAIGYTVSLTVASDDTYRAALASGGSRPAVGVASVTAQLDAPWALSGPVGTGLGDRAAGWSAITRAIARRGNVFVIGDVRVPRFTSARVDTAAMHLNPEYGLDLTSLRLR